MYFFSQFTTYSRISLIEHTGVIKIKIFFDMFFSFYITGKWNEQIEKKNFKITGHYTKV